VEAPAKSGALITAHFALEQGRDLWVAAAGLGSEGAARLVEDGAGIVYSAADIAREWGLCPPAEGREAGEDSIGKTLAASLARQLTIG
jgi:DNA processing protein